MYNPPRRVVGESRALRDSKLGRKRARVGIQGAPTELLVKQLVLSRNKRGWRERQAEWESGPSRGRRRRWNIDRHPLLLPMHCGRRGEERGRSPARRRSVRAAEISERETQTAEVSGVNMFLRGSSNDVSNDKLWLIIIGPGRGRK